MWDVIEWGNSAIFSIVNCKKLAVLNDVIKSVSNEYIFRLATIEDTDMLLQFFKEQPESSFCFFKPHGFDENSIKKIIKNKAFLTFVVTKDNTIVGYFFLRCFINGKCFRGKIVHKEWQGRGIAKLMGVAMTRVSLFLKMRMFGSISPDNFASFASAKASNNIKVHKILENGYYYIEFLPKTLNTKELYIQ